MSEAELIFIFCALVEKEEKEGERIFDKLLSIFF